MYIDLASIGKQVLIQQISEPEYVQTTKPFSPFFFEAFENAKHFVIRMYITDILLCPSVRQPICRLVFRPVFDTSIHPSGEIAENFQKLSE